MVTSDTRLLQTISHVARFYDKCKIGYEGTLGYRKSTDLKKLGKCLLNLTARGLIDASETVFLDLGCADGRVNVLASFFVKKSLGIEIDPEIMAEYAPRRAELIRELEKTNHLQVPDNIVLFKGDSLEASTHENIRANTGIALSGIDLFYTYITLHDLFGTLIAREGKQGALYLVYGFNSVLPSYPQLRLINPDVAAEGIAALYIRE